MADGDTDQLTQLVNQFMAQSGGQMPSLPPDASTTRSPNLSTLGLLGQALGGGMSGAVPMTQQEQEAAGGRALLNFGLNLMAASGPSLQRRSVGQILAQGLGGAGEAMAASESTAAQMQAAQQDWALKQQQMRMEALKAAMPLLQTQYQMQMAAQAGKTLLGQGNAPAGGGGDFNSFIIGSEGTGSSKTSSAAGIGQFLESTWGDFVKDNPTLFAGMTPQQVLDARNNPDIANKAITWLANKNATDLASKGVAPTGQSLGIAHYLGSGVAAQVMQAPDGTMIRTLVPASYVKANPELEDMTVGDMKRRYANAPTPSFLQPYKVASTGPTPPPPSGTTGPAVAPPPTPAQPTQKVTTAPAQVTPPAPDIAPLPSDAARVMARLRNQPVPISNPDGSPSGMSAMPDGSAAQTPPTKTATAAPAAAPPAAPATVAPPPPGGAPPSPSAPPVTTAAATPAQAPTTPPIRPDLQAAIDNPMTPEQLVPYDQRIAEAQANRQASVAQAQANRRANIVAATQAGKDPVQAAHDADAAIAAAQKDGDAAVSAAQKDKLDAIGAARQKAIDAKNTWLAAGESNVNAQEMERIKAQTDIMNKRYQAGQDQVNAYQGRVQGSQDLLNNLAIVKQILPTLPKQPVSYLQDPQYKKILEPLTGLLPPGVEQAVNSTDLFQKVIDGMITTMGAQTPGGQPVAREASLDQLRAMLPSLSQSAEGREQITMFLESLARRRIAEGDFMQRYQANKENFYPGTLVPDMSGAVPAMNKELDQTQPILRLAPPVADPDKPTAQESASYNRYFKSVPVNTPYVFYEKDAQGEPHPVLLRKKPGQEKIGDGDPMQ